MTLTLQAGLTGKRLHRIENAFKDRRSITLNLLLLLQTGRALSSRAVCALTQNSQHQHPGSSDITEF